MTYRVAKQSTRVCACVYIFLIISPPSNRGPLHLLPLYLPFWSRFSACAVQLLLLTKRNAHSQKVRSDWSSPKRLVPPTLNTYI